MGEAKRRKKLDPSYGQVHSLKNLKQREKHFDSLLEELFNQFKPELRKLILAEYIPDDYLQIKENISLWLETKLSGYRSEDKTMFANSLLLFGGEINLELDSSPILFMCFMEVIKPYLSEEEWSAIDRLADLKDLKSEFENQN